MGGTPSEGSLNTDAEPFLVGFRRSFTAHPAQDRSSPWPQLVTGV
jgi:hypothetical protein